MRDVWKGDCVKKLKELIAPNAKTTYLAVGAVKVLHTQRYSAEEIGHALYSIGRWRAEKMIICLSNITDKEHAQEVIGNFLDEAVSKEV